MVDFLTYIIIADNGPPDFSWVIPVIVFLLYIIGGIAKFFQQQKKSSPAKPAKQPRSPRDVKSPREETKGRTLQTESRASRKARRDEDRHVTPHRADEESPWQRLARQKREEARELARTGLKSEEIQQTPEIKSMEQAMQESEQQGMEVPSLTRDIAKGLQDPQSLRKAVIFSEILKPPVSMRDDSGWV
ncbi:hypothetical protein STSP2_02338 [Anaerohalosphaera lusitana]|uniref:Uncharacterized protein n=1 Tax=Anaerohalosphaera lusitana TaxID=1936003 RepID=A0A1U9NMK7_9BACT|nr:hypothetical protein [Anaerohalosphaera lusitana]AQT69151.1 hypothetical protein STSP2_02338 [Anaerohalosphaera lusitana]